MAGSGTWYAPSARLAGCPYWLPERQLFAKASAFSMASAPLVIAHRGWSGHGAQHGENTLPAFAAAIEAGADAVECDVHLSADGEVVVIHDESVNRTTDSTGRVDALTVAQLGALDAGGGAPVPTLASLLELIAGRCTLLLELKTRETAKATLHEGLARKVGALIATHTAEPWVIVQSFDARYLHELRPLSPMLRLGLLVYPWRLVWDYSVLESNASVAPMCVNPSHLRCTRSLVSGLHARGVKVFCWTVDSEAAMDKAMRAGVDGVITNRTDLGIRAREHFVSTTPAA